MKHLKRLDHIVVGVSGSSSAHEVSEFIDLLQQHIAHQVTVLCTPSAVKFVSQTGISYLTDEDWVDMPTHTLLAAQADEFIIAPATTNTLAKCALGIADNLVTTTFLAFTGAAFFVPGTNGAMWNAAITQRHVAELRSRGHHVLNPGPAVAASTGILGDAVGRGWRSAVAEIIECRSLY
ncbi:flavoprotein [Streptomyces sp. NPDC020794]|uniref:flavoprotein n=1 Tax=unclassified Streptomyces TaxID=2593676 RepID=UPI0036EDA50A